MGQSAAQAAAFYEEVAKSGKVWSLKDEAGFPAPEGDGGKRAMPFWSSSARVKKIIETVPAYSEFSIVELTVKEYKEKWLPGLRQDGFNVGVNWTGSKATGFDVDPLAVLESIEYHEAKST